MKENALELVFILDKSGSMQPFTDDTIGGFNSVLDKQKAQAADIMVTTVLFNSRIDRLHDRLPASEVPHITCEEYTAYGSTALYDAVGSTIEHIENVHRYIRPEDIPAKTLFVITTDGLENASRRYTRQQIKEMIERKKEEDGWEFLFLAADIETEEVAESIGIRADRSASYKKDSRGIRVMYQKLDRVVDAVSRSRFEDVDWEAVLRDDEE